MDSQSVREASKLSFHTWVRFHDSTGDHEPPVRIWVSMRVSRLRVKNVVADWMALHRVSGAQMRSAGTSGHDDLVESLRSSGSQSTPASGIQRSATWNRMRAGALVVYTAPARCP
jgi:hypothetical protein